jgi:regulator of nucleoside diphosphate kinase
MKMNAATSAITALPQIRMTIWNFCKLDSLLIALADEWCCRAAALLGRELKRSFVVDDNQIPSNVATMGSRIEFRIEGTGLTQVSTLVYPGDGHLYEDAISVLTPLGSAILGLSEGQSISYAGPDGGPVKVTILRILHQPEADRRRKTRRVDETVNALQLELV